MRKLFNHLLLSMILTLLSCTIGTALTSQNSTQESSTQSATAKTEAAAAQTKAEVRGLRADLFERQIARLIAEIKASRELISTQRAHAAALEERLTAEQKNSSSLTDSYALAEQELGSKQLAITALGEAIAAKNEALTTLTTQRDKERRRAARANRRLFFTIAAAVVTGFVLAK